MPLSAMEGFVLSRIDGVVSVGELVAACGLSEGEGARILQKLVDLGALDLLGVAEETAGASPPPPASGRSDRGTGRDVTPAFRERIGQMLLRSEQANFYELLGMAPDADRAEIRASYFELSKEFHPDSYYGKDLGEHRARMETVFGRLTTAYETLSKKPKRARYDEYIADQIRAWEMEQRLAQIPELVLYRVKAQPSPDEAAVEPAHEPAAEARTAPSAPPSPAPRLGPESEVHRRLREQKKRRTLQALLKATGKATAPTKPVEVFVPTTAEQKLAIQYAVAGVDALERHEYMTALNSFELALQITPDDAKVHAAVNRVRDEANAALSRTYESQGAYEEELGQHLRAAQSFAKALELHQGNHSLMARAASNLLRGNGNLKRAQELVRKAIEADPTNIDYKATLGEILLKAGARAEAERVLSEAARLGPNDARVQRLLKVGNRS